MNIFRKSDKRQKWRLVRRKRRFDDSTKPRRTLRDRECWKSKQKFFKVKTIVFFITGWRGVFSTFSIILQPRVYESEKAKRQPVKLSLKATKMQFWSLFGQFKKCSKIWKIFDQNFYFLQKTTPHLTSSPLTSNPQPPTFSRNFDQTHARFQYKQYKWLNVCLMSFVFCFHVFITMNHIWLWPFNKFAF